MSHNQQMVSYVQTIFNTYYRIINGIGPGLQQSSQPVEAGAEGEMKWFKAQFVEAEISIM